MKRFISILLAMCMCMSIGVCGITASAETATKPTISTGADRVTDSTITYYFDTRAFGITDSAEPDIKNSEASFTIEKFTDGGAGTRNAKSAKWGLFGMSGHYGNNDVYGNKALVRAQSIQWEPKVPEIGAVFDLETEDRIYSLAFELDVEKAGEYIPSLTYFGSTIAPKVEIYVLPKPEGAEAWTNYDEFVKTLDTDDRLCEADLYYTSVETQTKELPKVTLSKGSNLFIMVLNGMRTEPQTVSYSDGRVNYYKEFLRPQYLSLTPINKTLEYDFSLSAFEYEKMPRYSANDATWTGVRSSSTATPSNVTIEDTGFSGVQNTEFFGWNKQLNAVAKVEDGKVVQNEYEEAELYYTMKSREDDTYWSLECVSTGSQSHRAWKAAFYSFFASSYFSTENETKDSSKRPLTAFRINVSSAGEYKLGISTGKTYAPNDYTGTGIVSNVYVMKAPESAITVAQIDEYISNGSFKHLGTHDSSVKSEEYTTVGNNTSFTASEPGEYILLFDTDENSFAKSGITNPTGNYHLVVSGIKLTPVITKSEAEVEKEKIENEDGNTISATDTAETSVTVKQGKAVLGGDTEPTFTEVEVNSDGYATVTATETDENGNKFLYWAKGLKTGIGKKVFVPDNDNELSCTFKPETGVNYIIAVYAPASGSTGETRYCNANGQLLTDADENTVPTMPGYTFAEWVDCGNGMKVADYTENETTYTVTVKHQDGEAEAVEKETLSGKKYGDSVTVTAPSRFGGSGYNVFNYWEKDGKTVSFNKSYTFNVWETCDVTAVYKAYAPVATTLKKIIIDNMGGNNLMAEFIGFGDVAEKGIVFGTNATLTDNEGKATMTSNKTQFTVNNDIDGTPAARGYVIDKAGNVYYGN